MTKLAKDLRQGDRVISEDGRVLTVKEIGRGFWAKSVLIVWGEPDLEKPWSCLDRTTAIELSN